MLQSVPWWWWKEKKCLPKYQMLPSMMQNNHSLFLVLKWFPSVNLALINVARVFNKLARYQILCRELHVPVKTTGGKVMNGSRWIKIILIRQKRRWCDNSNSKKEKKKNEKQRPLRGHCPLLQVSTSSRGIITLPSPRFEKLSLGWKDWLLGTYPPVD